MYAYLWGVYQEIKVIRKFKILIMERKNTHTHVHYPMIYKLCIHGAHRLFARDTHQLNRNATENDWKWIWM